MSNFESLVQKLQSNKMRLCQNKEELANIVKSLDIKVPIKEPALVSVPSKPFPSNPYLDKHKIHELFK